MQGKYIGFLLALISMTGLGISNFLYKRSTDAIGAVNTTFHYYLFSLGIAMLVWYFFREKKMPVVEELHWPALIALSLFTSVLAFNYAIKYIEVSIGSTIRSLAFLVTVVLAVIFYKEQLHLKDYVALAFAFSAIVLFSI
ncbi:MAG: DMT family transporter [Psychromonas sp.]|nr:DMT family transporter [Psychromonas sp.]